MWPQEIETIRRGDFEPADLVELAPEAAVSDEGREALYDGLRVTVADLLRSGASQNHIAEWRNVLMHLIGVAEEVDIDQPAKRALLIARLDTLRDISADAVAHETYYSIDRLSEFPTYRELLGFLREQGGRASRRAVLEALGLRQSNGTRTLKLLESVHLLRRHRIGGEVVVELTRAGDDALNKWSGLTVSEPAIDPIPFLPVLVVMGSPIPGSQQRYYAGRRQRV